MSSAPIPEGVPPGAPVVPQGPVPAVGVPNSQDYPRLVYTAPRFEVVAIADIIEPSVLEACEALLPTLVPPYVNQAAIDAVNATAVRRAGDTMTGPLNLSPVIPTANAMAASKQYVDTMIATGAIPEVPPVPSGQAWARETGQWVPIAGGGTVTNIATGAGLTGGPITGTGTIAMANMNGNTLKGNNTGAVAAPTDLNVGQVMAMLGAAPLNSPTFTGSPSLPTATAAVTQPGGTSDSTVATTAFVTQMVNASAASALQLSGGTMLGPIVLAGNAAANLNPVPLQQLNTTLAGYAPIASPVFTGSPSLPAGSFGVTQTAGTSNTSLATTAFVGAAITASAANYLPLTGGTLSGPGNLTVRGGILAGVAGSVPAAGALTLNANTVAPPASGLTPSLWAVGADNTSPQILSDGYGTGAPGGFVGRRARGAAAAPTALGNGDNILVITGVGRAATGYSIGAAPQIQYMCTENWTDTAQGSSIRLITAAAGTTTPVAGLILAGNTATFSGNIVSTAQTVVNGASDSALNLQTSSRAYAWINRTSDQAIWLYDATAGLARIIISSAGACAASSAWGVISDAALKTDIADHRHGLAEILQLQPRRFRMVDDDRMATGLIAQELEAIMPELVGEMATADGGTVKTVTETGIIWPLVNAIKELKAEIDALKAGRTA